MHVASSEHVLLMEDTETGWFFYLQMPMALRLLFRQWNFSTVADLTTVFMVWFPFIAGSIGIGILIGLNICASLQPERCLNDPATRFGSHPQRM